MVEIGLPQKPFLDTAAFRFPNYEYELAKRPSATSPRSGQPATGRGQEIGLEKPDLPFAWFIGQSGHDRPVRLHPGRIRSKRYWDKRDAVSSSLNASAPLRSLHIDGPNFRFKPLLAKLLGGPSGNSSTINLSKHLATGDSLRGFYRGPTFWVGEEIRHRTVR